MPNQQITRAAAYSEAYRLTTELAGKANPNDPETQQQYHRLSELLAAFEHDTLPQARKKLN